MKTLRLALLLLAFAMVVVPLMGQPPPGAGVKTPLTWDRPYLYRIESDGVARGWLLGTIHLDDPALDTLPREVEQAFAESAAVYTEVALDPGALLAASNAIFDWKGPVLRERIGPELHDRLGALARKRNLPMNTFNHLKTWAVGANLASIDFLRDPINYEPLDKALYGRAIREKKEVGGLESVQEQFSIFESLTADEQKAFLELAIREIERSDREGVKPHEALLRAFLAGDSAKLMAELDQSFDPREPIAVKLRKALLTDRDLRLAQRIDEKVKGAPEKMQLFAIGAAHLITKDSVVDHLGKLGYTLTRQ